MSRADRIIARRNEELRGTRYLRPKNKQPKPRAYFDAKTGKVESIIPKHHRTDDWWWRIRFADLVERKQDDGTYAAKPKRATAPAPKRDVDAIRAQIIASLPSGLPRQQTRYRYQHACKAAGIAPGPIGMPAPGASP